MQMHIRGGDAGQHRRFLEAALWLLVAVPHVHSVVGNQDCCVARFHAGAANVRYRVSGFHHFRRATNCGVDVTFVDDRLAGIVQCGQVALEKTGGADATAGSAIPFDRHRIERSLGVPPRVRNHRDSAAIGHERLV